MKRKRQITISSIRLSRAVSRGIALAFNKRAAYSPGQHDIANSVLRQIKKQAHQAGDK